MVDDAGGVAALVEAQEGGYPMKQDKLFWLLDQVGAWSIAAWIILTNLFMARLLGLL